MEKEFTLKAYDNAQIECIINTAEKSSDTVIIFVHGLTGGTSEHLYFNAAKSFPKEGVDTFRFALYGYGEKDRKLTNCSISDHGNDINSVIEYLRPKYKTIAIVGHSLGSPSILKSDTDQVDVVILWEPSYTNAENSKFFKTVNLNGEEAFMRTGRFDYLMSKEMISEWKEFDGNRELPQIASLCKPLLIIAAQNGILVPGSKKYYEVAQEPKKLVVVDGATHCFNEEGTEKEVFRSTLEWIKKYSK